MNDDNYRKTVKRGTDEWYLYHSYKNEDALYYALILGFCAIFLKQGLGLEILIWGYYAWYCFKNNNDLDNNPRILALRKEVRETGVHYII